LRASIHRVIAHTGQALLRHLEAAVSGGFAPCADVEAAAATYLAYHRDHMAREEAAIMSRAGELLSAADWAEVAAVVPKGDERTALALQMARALGL
jgi:hypothetical protein